MAQEELIRALTIRKKELEVSANELKAELEAIETLIGVYNNSDAIVLDGTPIKRSRRTNFGSGTPPKGSTSWEDYALNILKVLGEARTSEVVERAIEANAGSQYSESTIRNAISSKLSRLCRANVIEANVPAYKKDGYTYKIKKESNDSL